MENPAVYPSPMCCLQWNDTTIGAIIVILPVEHKSSISCLGMVHLMLLLSEKGIYFEKQKNRGNALTLYSVLQGVTYLLE